MEYNHPNLAALTALYRYEKKWLNFFLWIFHSENDPTVALCGAHKFLYWLDGSDYDTKDILTNGEEVWNACFNDPLGFPNEFYPENFKIYGL